MAKGKKKQRNSTAAAATIGLRRQPAQLENCVHDTLDLHGLTAAAALVEVRRHLAARRGQRVRLISGKGAHSINGVSVIKERVSEALDSVHIPHVWADGVFTIDCVPMELGWLGEYVHRIDVQSGCIDSAAREPSIQVKQTDAPIESGKVDMGKQAGLRAANAFPTLDAAAQLALSPAEIAMRLSRLDTIAKGVDQDTAEDDAAVSLMLQVHAGRAITQ